MLIMAKFDEKPLRHKEKTVILKMEIIGRGESDGSVSFYADLQDRGRFSVLTKKTQNRPLS